VEAKEVEAKGVEATAAETAEARAAEATEEGWAAVEANQFLLEVGRVAATARGGLAEAGAG